MHGVSVEVAIRSCRAILAILEAHIQWGNYGYWTPADVVHSILAVQHRYRRLKRKLMNSWNSIQSWKKELPLNLRKPMPEVVLMASSRPFTACLGPGNSQGLFASAFQCPRILSG